MSDRDLVRRIRLGEDARLEFKSVQVTGGRVHAPDRRALADELAAFANSRGGTLLLGVDDKTRRVHGIPLDDLDVVERWVREVCNDSVQPSLDADIRKQELPAAGGRTVAVLRVDVERSLFVHKSPGGYFRRIGSAKRELPPEVLARLFQERSQSRVIRFDERAVFEALVNAAAHRDYSIAGARIRLHLFGDRLELYVPGGLVNTLTPDTLHLRQANRNELIVSLLARCAAPSGVGRTRLMDTRGDGVPIIRRECRELSGRLPEYRVIDDGELRLVIPAAGRGGP